MAEKLLRRMSGTSFFGLNISVIIMSGTSSVLNISIIVMAGISLGLNISIIIMAGTSSV